MARIYFALALLSLSLLAVNIVLGLLTEDYGEAASVLIDRPRKIDGLRKSESPDQAQIQEWEAELQDARTRQQQLRGKLTLHMLFGVASALVAVLVNSISVTYFVGTSRWCREVVEAYRLPPALAEQSQRLKRKTFPWALAGMLTIVVLVALGALADPSVMLNPERPERHLFWRTLHLFGAIIGTLLIGYSYYIQTQNVAANYGVIDQILADVRRIRQERGLDDNAPAPGAAAS